MNVGASRLMEAFHAMTPEAAALILSAAQMYAERHPKPLQKEHFLVEGARSVDAVHEIGELSPIGVCVVRWNDRRYTYLNESYQKYFRDLGRPEAVIGARIDEIVPEFVERGMLEVFDRVAATGKPERQQAFECGGSYWDWSVAKLPTAAGDDVCLLVQASRVVAPALYAVN
jgi:hypothetical protein